MASNASASVIASAVARCAGSLLSVAMRFDRVPSCHTTCGLVVLIVTNRQIGYGLIQIRGVPSLAREDVRDGCGGVRPADQQDGCVRYDVVRVAEDGPEAISEVAAPVHEGVAVRDT